MSFNFSSIFTYFIYLNLIFFTLSCGVKGPPIPRDDSTNFNWEKNFISDPLILSKQEKIKEMHLELLSLLHLEEVELQKKFSQKDVKAQCISLLQRRDVMASLSDELEKEVISYQLERRKIFAQKKQNDNRPWKLIGEIESTRKSEKELRTKVEGKCPRT